MEGRPSQHAPWRALADDTEAVNIGGGKHSGTYFREPEPEPMRPGQYDDDPLTRPFDGDS